MNYVRNRHLHTTTFLTPSSTDNRRGMPHSLLPPPKHWTSTLTNSPKLGQPWKSVTLFPPTGTPEENTPPILYYCDPVDILQYLLSNSALQNGILWAPSQIYQDEVKTNCLLSDWFLHWWLVVGHSSKRCSSIVVHVFIVIRLSSSLSDRPNCLWGPLFFPSSLLLIRPSSPTLVGTRLHGQFIWHWGTFPNIFIPIHHQVHGPQLHIYHIVNGRVFSTTPERMTPSMVYAPASFSMLPSNMSSNLWRKLKLKAFAWLTAMATPGIAFLF